jgi:hypothetical protein
MAVQLIRKKNVAKRESCVVQIEILGLWTCGPGSSVGTATGYGLDGPGIESRWEAKIFPPDKTGPVPHPASFTNGNGYFSGVKRDLGVTLTPHPF